MRIFPRPDSDKTMHELRHRLFPDPPAQRLLSGRGPIQLLQHLTTRKGLLADRTNQQAQLFLLPAFDSHDSH